MAPRPPAALGWLFVVPALIGAALSLVLPTVQTILTSLRDSRGLRDDAPFVGLDNYVRLFGEAGFWRALAFSLSLVLLPLLVVAVVAPLLALALDQGGSWVRQAGRVVISLPLVVFSPVANALSWRQQRIDGGIAALLGDLADPGTTRLVVAAATFGVVCGLAVLAYLPALRGGSAAPAMVAVGGVLVLATLAAGLQSFAFSFTPASGDSETLATFTFSESFRFMRFGLGAAASTVSGLILAVLGLLTTLIVLLSRMRIALVPREQARVTPMAVLGVLGLILFAGAALLGSWPWLTGVLTGQPVPHAGLRTYVITWLPAILGAVVSVGTAYLAALGIGALRPLGRGSEWLLLAFAPWLLVGLGPLSLALWEDERGLGLLGTFVAFIPPVLVSVPALVIMTLFFRGQAELGGPFLPTVVLPSLPLAALLAGAVTLVNAQDLQWPVVVATEAADSTAPVLLAAAASGYAGGPHNVAITTPIAVVVVALAGLVAAQLAFLDRLALKTGETRSLPSEGGA